jgi:hypothetical protein
MNRFWHLDCPRGTGAIAASLACRARKHGETACRTQLLVYALPSRVGQSDPFPLHFRGVVNRKLDDRDRNAKTQSPGGAKLLTTSRLKYLHLAYLSKPISDRIIYRGICKRKVHKILEIGIGTADRAQRMIGVAQRNTSGEPCRYVAVDPFEARRPQDGPGLSLKEAHRLLKATGAQVQLIPGEPAAALARAANALANMDLVVISSDYDLQALAEAWFYLPRMLHAGSQVYLESRPAPAAERTLTLLSPAEIEARASVNRRRRAA